MVHAKWFCTYICCYYMPTPSSQWLGLVLFMTYKFQCLCWRRNRLSRTTARGGGNMHRGHLWADHRNSCIILQLVFPIVGKRYRYSLRSCIICCTQAGLPGTNQQPRKARRLCPIDGKSKNVHHVIGSSRVARDRDEERRSV